MKKQIRSALLFLSVSFQAVYPVLGSIEQKNNIIPSWWRVRTLLKVAKEADKKLDSCKKMHCVREIDENNIAFQAWQKDTLISKNHLFDVLLPSYKQWQEKNKSYLTCLQKHCAKEYEISEKLHIRRFDTILAISLIAYFLGTSVLSATLIEWPSTGKTLWEGWTQ